MYVSDVTVDETLSLAQLSVQKLLMIGDPFLPEILDQTDRVGAKSPIFDIFSLIATEL